MRSIVSILSPVRQSLLLGTIQILILSLCAAEPGGL
jgi:hypothetical protein